MNHPQVNQSEYDHGLFTELPMNMEMIIGYLESVYKVLNRVVETKNPSYDDIMIAQNTLAHIPQWISFIRGVQARYTYLERNTSKRTKQALIRPNKKTLKPRKDQDKSGVKR